MKHKPSSTDPASKRREVREMWTRELCAPSPCFLASAEWDKIDHRTLYDRYQLGQQQRAKFGATEELRRLEQQPQGQGFNFRRLWRKRKQLAGYCAHCTRRPAKKDRTLCQHCARQQALREQLTRLRTRRQAPPKKPPQRAVVVVETKGIGPATKVKAS